MRERGRATARWRSRLAWVFGCVILLPSGSGAAEPLRFRTLESDRTGHLAREWVREAGRRLLGARDLLEGRDRLGPPDAAELGTLSEWLGAPPGSLSAFSADGRVVWFAGPPPPRLPPDLAPGVFRAELGEGEAEGQTAVWIPARPEGEAPAWFRLGADLPRLLAQSLPTQELAGAEALVAWRLRPLAPWVGGRSDGAPVPLADPEWVRKRAGLKPLLNGMAGRERGVHAYVRFDAGENRLVRCRVEWFPLLLAGLPLVATLEVEYPFAASARDASGRWRRQEPGAREAFDLLLDGTGWTLVGRDGWSGLRLEGRELDGTYTATRLESRQGLPGLNSFAARRLPEGVLVADVYQIRNGAMHHFVYRFTRESPVLNDPSEELPLKLQVR
jgi:hypothetical protein